MRTMFVRPKGFTLIELLVVISILGLLSTIVFASLLKARQKGQISSTDVQLKQLQTAFQFFYENYLDYPPLPVHTDFCNMCTYWPPSVPYARGDWQTDILDQIKADGLLGRDILDDPWGNPYLYDKNYKMMQAGSFEGWSPICSMGPDGILQTPNAQSWPATPAAGGDDICIFLPND